MCCICLQSFLFGQSAEISIELDDQEKRKKVDVKNEEGKKEKLPLYFDGESVSGKVSVHIEVVCDSHTHTHTPHTHTPGPYQTERKELGAQRDSC